MPKPVSPSERGMAEQLIQRQLQGDHMPSGRAMEATRVFTANNPPPSIYSGPALTDDPAMEMAVHLLQQQVPELFKGVGSIFIGNTLPPRIGGTTGPDMDIGGKAISLRHSGGDTNKAIDTLRHELSHVAGLGDMGSPSAYDVGEASSVLHRDIALPKEGR